MGLRQLGSLAAANVLCGRKGLQSPLTDVFMLAGAAGGAHNSTGDTETVWKRAHSQAAAVETCWHSARLL